MPTVFWEVNAKPLEYCWSEPARRLPRCAILWGISNRQEWMRNE